MSGDIEILSQHIAVGDGLKIISFLGEKAEYKTGMAEQKLNTIRANPSSNNAQ